MGPNNQITIALTAEKIPGIPLAVGDPVSLSKALSIPSKWEVTTALGRIARIGGTDAKQIDFRLQHQGSPKAWVSAIQPQLEITIVFVPRNNYGTGIAPAPVARRGLSAAALFAITLGTVVALACLLTFMSQRNPNNSTGAAPPPATAQDSNTPQASSDPDSSSPEAPIPTPDVPAQPSLPSDLIAFNKANADAMAAYPQADNDLKKTEIKQARDASAMAALQGGTFTSWPGTLKTLGTTGDGDAYIAVQLDGCGCTLETTNNTFSESIDEASGRATLIKKGSPLYITLRDMHEGDRVVVSGRIFTETSLTEGGSISDPAWETAFTNIAPEPK